MVTDLDASEMMLLQSVGTEARAICPAMLNFRTQRFQTT